MRDKLRLGIFTLSVTTFLSPSAFAAFQDDPQPTIVHLAGLDQDGDNDSTFDDQETDNDSQPTVSNSSAATDEPLTSEPAPKPKKEAIAKKKGDLKKKVASAYKDPFYLNDFNYLNDPSYQGHNLGENFKQLPIGKNGKLDVGGQYRLRYHGEHNFRGQGLTGRDDDFLLDRTRIYADYKLNKKVRVFTEFLDAGSSYENFAPRIIEVQQFDLQNLFTDLVLIESDLGKLTGRAGRQELLFGSQRLISPFDWANIRRRFDGGRLIWETDERTTDLLLVRPENLFFNASDSANLNQALWGIYNSNKTFKNSPIETYYLGFEDTLTNLHVHTLGTAIKGEADGLLWDNEFGYQFGRNPDGSDISAFSLTFGAGAKSSAASHPTLWLYYDWASGDDAINSGWNQLFPLAHKFLGFMDLFGRRNIHDVNTLATVSPTERFTALAWYHCLFLANDAQGPYNVNNTPFNPGGTVGDRFLGQELDLLGTYKINSRSDLVLGYSHFFTGTYYDTSLRADGSSLFNGDADFFYTQWHYNF